MSTLSQFAGGGGAIKSIQRGYASTGTVQLGMGQDTRYIDVAISEVNTSKSMIIWEGGAGYGPSPNAALSKALSKTSSEFSVLVSIRFINSTTIRISTEQSIANYSHVFASWQVVEFM